MEKIQNNNPDIEIILSNGKFIIQDKIIIIGGAYNGS